MLGKINLSLLVLLGLLLSTRQPNTEIEQSINLLHDQVFFALGPKEEELNRALENNFPEWANYEQNVRWDSEPAKLGEIVKEASFQEQFALNPAVTLVTLGESLDWQLPSDSDLFLQSITIGERLNYLWFEWANPENENIRVQNPEVSNGATYALYVFFDHDKNRLQAWQDTYYRLFGEYPSQPPTSTFLQSSATTVEPFLARPFYNPDNSFYTVNSFFDHQFPRYAGEGDGYKDTLYRFDGISLENAAFNPCTLQVNCYSGHDAIDYNTGENWPIRAAASGTVVDKFQDTGTVLVQHENDLFTVYMHLNTIFVNTEDNVQLGDVIGEAGNKGTGGVHLHFGVRYPDNVEKDIDPFGWWSTNTDPWIEYPTLGQESTWLWKSDEAGDGYLTVDNRESQAQLFLHPESTPPDPPNIGWHRVVSGYQNEAWYTFMNQNTDTYAYWGIWGSTIEQAGEYVVQAYWPGDPDTNDEWLPASNAKYILYFHDNGVLRKETLYGNQTIGENQFNLLCKVEYPEGSCPDDQIARFTFDVGATSVILSNPAGYDPSQHQRMLFFDAIRWQQYVPPTPTFTPTATITPTPTPTGTPQATNNALRFQSPAASQALLMPSASNLNFGGDMTIEFWIRTTSTYGGSRWHDAQWILDKDISGSGKPDWAVVLRYGSIVFDNGTGGCCSDHTLYGIRTVNDGIWHHVAIVRNVSTENGLTTMFIDGVQDTSGIFSTGSLSNSLALMVGVENGVGSLNARAFRGDLDDLRLWNIARSQADIQGSMHTRLQGNETGLAGYWSMDEGTGQVASDRTQYFINSVLGSSLNQEASDPEWILESELFTGTPPTPVPTLTGPTATPQPLPCTCRWGENCLLTSSATGKKVASLSKEFAFITNNFDRISDQAALLYRVRDEVLSTTEEGQRYIDLYYEHSTEIAAIMLAHSELDEQGLDVIDALTPNLQALLDGQGDTAIITSAHVQQAQAFLDALIPYASPELQQAIEDERDRYPLENLIGVTVDRAWTYLNGFPSTSVLDDFNRANGPIGANWSGYKTNYEISSNQLRLKSSGSNTDIYWSASSFGPDQEAYLTFSDLISSASEQDLLLKSQSASTWGSGVLEVWYDAPHQRVQVWTYKWPQGWVKRGADIPVTFVDGDTFGARARPDGMVEVYRNGELLATRDITAWPHYADGGYIGMWFAGAYNARLDDFGGGTVSGGSGLRMPVSGPNGEIEDGQLNVALQEADVFWQGVPFGTGQAANVTFATLRTEAKTGRPKPQSNGVWGEGTLQLLYEVPDQRIQVWMYQADEGWTQVGRDMPVRFAQGDQFRALVGPDGVLELFRNGKLFAKQKIR